MAHLKYTRNLEKWKRVGTGKISTDSRANKSLALAFKELNEDLVYIY